MSHDKLHLTARAAGFAMACDEAADGPTARQAPPQLSFASAQRMDANATQRPSTALVPIRAARPSIGFGLMGWSFWKTA